MQAMIPNAWLTEGGQSAVGWLIDHVIDTYVTIPDIPLIDQTIVTLRENRSKIKRSKKTAPCSIF
jgi:ribulose kinase